MCATGALMFHSTEGFGGTEALIFLMVIDR